MDVARAIVRAHEPVGLETDATLVPEEGRLPPQLRGVLYRNGSGGFADPGAHPFDGDGMVARFELDGRTVRYKNRFVDTQEREAERAAGRRLYRGFGSNLPGGLRSNLLRVRFKNAANTSVVAHGGKLLALWEGGLPHELDPRTLETVGRYDFGGQLRGSGPLLDRWLMPELPFSAHPKLDPATGELWGFGTRMGYRPRLMLYRVDADGRMDEPRALPLRDLTFIHDFLLTPRYRVFFLAPFSFDVMRMVLGLEPPAAALRWRGSGRMRIWLVDRDTDEVTELDASPGFVFHFVHGHETSDGRVVALGLKMDGFPDPGLDLGAADAVRSFQYPPPKLVRFVIDPARGKVSEERVRDLPMELPATDAPDSSGEPCRRFWATANPHEDRSLRYTAIARIDLDGGHDAVRDFAPGFPSEPTFVPDPAGGPGFLLTVVYDPDAHRSDLHVLDAHSLATRWRGRLPHHLPPGFHGCWAPSG
jgi:all-trans-8'-apo-beta-carotenal 15,15'-oxygenase